MKKKIALLLILFCTIFYGHIVSAQFNTVGPTAISVETIPQIPGPDTQVRATVDSYGTDLNKAQISWYINGKKELSGKGEKTFDFKTGGLNSVTTLSVTVVTSTGETISKTYEIKPSSVDIIWQNDGYVPPFYKGKALYSYQNKITFIAIPHLTNDEGVELNPNNLIYKWTKNGAVVNDFSGYGKSTYTMISTIISRPIKMEVEVTSANSDVIAYSNIYVEPKDPTILMYEKNPLYGFMFEKALTGDVTLNSKEIEIAAFPYFFGTLARNTYDLPYIWKINGTKIDNDTSQISRTFRPKEGTSGLSQISVSIDNINKVLQSAKGSFNLQFDASTTTQTTI